MTVLPLSSKTSHGAGYIAPPTGGEVLDLGILDTEENLLEDLHTDWRLPTHIRVGVQLAPQWATPGPELEYIEDGVSKGAIPALDPEGYKLESRALVHGGVVEAIQFQYRGYAQLIYADGEKETVYGETWNGSTLRLEEGNILFRKPFAILPAGRHTYTAVRHGGHWHVTPPGAMDHFPRFALGGYYSLQATVEQMEQLYVTMDQEDGRTIAHAERSSSYAQRFGSYPPKPVFSAGSYIVFPHAASPLQQLSMADAIAQGHIPLQIQVGAKIHQFVSLSYNPMAFSYMEILFQYAYTRVLPS